MVDLFYSAARGGFFDDAVHPVLPPDAVAITAARHAELLAAQAAGRTIVAGRDGRPRAVERPVTVEERRALLAARIKREAERRILAVAPIWRQLNDARALAGSTGPARAAIEARAAAIDTIRAASDRFEREVAAMSARALAQVDVAADLHWPS